ncbi:MAG: HAMP domain-containing histidine kinase [Clostridia bacterium]
MNEILEETVGSYYNIFKKKDIIPNIKICEKKIYKNIDKTKVIRIFENLISNCIRYSDNGCNIELKESGKVVFSNKASKLDSMTVKKIFDRYYTIENIDKNSGVGLSIAKQLVELNGGNIVAKYLKDVLYIEIELE